MGVEITEGDLNGLEAQSDLAYSFVVSGPESTLVPIDISATGGVSAAPTSTNGGVLGAIAGEAAELNITSSGDTLLDDAACAGSLAASITASCLVTYPEPTFSISDQTFEVETNQVYTVDLSAETLLAYASYDPPPVGTGLMGYTADAYIDPTIVLDPSAGSQYTLSFSSNLAPTPEPNYLPILLPCLGGLILCLNRSRRNSTTALPA